MDSPLRAGLAALVDYAGLFPPAALPVREVVERFGRYAESDERWMLGRLIVPLVGLDALDAVAESRLAPGVAWNLSVLVAGDAALDGVIARLRAFDDRHRARNISVRSVELAPASIDDVARFAAIGAPHLERYVEVPLGADTGRWLDAVARAGCFAKIRTGGLTADRFPAVADVATFIRDTVSRDLPFKATAGLHHPLRNTYPLTYERDSQSGRMHGFINLLLAAALARRDPGVEGETIARLLDASDPDAFAVMTNALAWRDVVLTTADLADARHRTIRSVGSCSFEEPVSDLRALGWLPADRP